MIKTLTVYEAGLVREIATALIAGRSYRKPMGPAKGRIMMSAAKLACRWEREGAAEIIREWV